MKAEEQRQIRAGSSSTSPVPANKDRLEKRKVWDLLLIDPSLPRPIKKRVWDELQRTCSTAHDCQTALDGVDEADPHVAEDGGEADGMERGDRA